MPKTKKPVKAPAKAPAKARAFRAPFTPAEDAAILAAAAEGKTNEEIADMLGRLTCSVWKRRQILARGKPQPRWFTAEEDRILLHQRSMGVSFPDIGKILRRPVQSVYSRYKSLTSSKSDLPPREYKIRRFTPEEDEKIVSMVKNNITDFEISERLGRSPSSVRTRHRMLSARGDLPPFQISRKSFSRAEDDAILSGAAAGLTDREIAQKIDRETYSVRVRRERLLARRENQPD